MATHAAVVTVAPRARLELHQVPTPTPKDNEILLRNEWTASTPLDLHQNDGHLLVNPPQILGDGLAGSVTQVGPNTTRLAVGDKVFGFALQGNKQKAHQEYVCVPENLLGKVPPGFSMEEAVTLPNNFVTVFHTLTAELGIDLPWPKPPTYTPKQINGREVVLLIWGGSSSVGQFALQVLKYYGYTNLLTTASAHNHPMLRSHGATALFDYTSPTVVNDIATTTAAAGIDLILDCIGSQSGSLKPLSQIAAPGFTVAVLLPVIVKDASEDQAPVYSMDTQQSAQWREGVVVKGVRTHFWMDNETFRVELQTVVMPDMLEMGVVKPNRYRVVEGEGLLERAEEALRVLRGRGVSGERLVWRVAG